jgi:replicative DNA helicase
MTASVDEEVLGPQLFDAQAERVVLGAMMLSEGAVDEVLDVLRVGDFYMPAHGILYAQLTAHAAANEPTDPVALAAGLEREGQLRRVGGSLYLHTLMTAVPTSAQAAWYARRVADFALRRRIAEAGLWVRNRAMDMQRDVADVVNEAQQAVLDATMAREDSQATSLADILDAGAVEELLDGTRGRGMSTGLGSLDHVIGGLKPGQLIVVAGRPGTGKSVLGVNLAQAATRRGVPALVVSLEMNRTEVLARIFAAEANVPLFKLLNGGLSLDDRMRVQAASQQLRTRPMHIDCTSTNDLASIRTMARRLKAKHGLGLLVVDYLQLMTPMTRRDSRALEMAEISRGLKILAGDLELPIVAPAQLNRGSEGRADKRPQLSDMRESGAIEADADVAILLHRPDLYDPETERAGEVDLIVAKNRNGPLETITCAGQYQYSRIVDMGLDA